ncbi:hypothetical protein Tco_0973291 [Tanacetum coccineum]
MHQKHLTADFLSLKTRLTFLLKGPHPTPKASSIYTPQAYVKAVSSNHLPRGPNEPPRKSSFTFRECVCPNPQPQALETSFEARVRDYMAAHTERMESRTSKNILMREEARHPITKNINSISLIRIEEEENKENNGQSSNSAMEPGKSDEEEPP